MDQPTKAQPPKRVYLGVKLSQHCMLRVCPLYTDSQLQEQTPTVWSKDSKISNTEKLASSYHNLIMGPLEPQMLISLLNSCNWKFVRKTHDIKSKG